MTPALPDRPPATGQGVREPISTGRTVDGPDAASGWVAVVGAHGGAGTSTVAVALADAVAAGGGRSVHLISDAAPHRSGLIAVTTAELGISDDGNWRRGRRGTHITVDRCARSADEAAQLWPVWSGTRYGERPLTILDADPVGHWPPSWLPAAAAVLVVFRATVPGVQHAERALAELRAGDTATVHCPLLLAAVGPRRWTRVVTAAVGTLLRQQQRDGQLVPVPLDRRLERTGLTSQPLPKTVAGAGAVLLRRLEPAWSPGTPLSQDCSPSWLTSPVALHLAAAGSVPPSPSPSLPR